MPITLQRRVPFLVAAVLAFVPAAASHAQFTYVWQTRTVSVFAPSDGPIPDQSASAYAPDLLPFHSSLHVRTGSEFADATQDSILAPSMVTAALSASSESMNGYAPRAESLFEVVFSVAQPTPYAFSGQETGFSSMQVWLQDAVSGRVLFSGFDSASGTLQMGTYRLHAYAQNYVSTSGPDRGASGTITFAVPAPASSLTLAGAMCLARRRRRERDGVGGPDGLRQRPAPTAGTGADVIRRPDVA